jgi:hypothetical protein
MGAAKPPSVIVLQRALDRRWMNLFHRVRRDALQALRTALDPDCCA